MRDGDATRGARGSGSAPWTAQCAGATCSAASPPRTDERALRAADLAGVPLLVVGPEREPRGVPYALATDVFRAGPAKGSRSRSSAGGSPGSSTRTPPSRSPRGCRRSGAASWTRWSRAVARQERGDRRSGVHSRRRLPGADAEPASPGAPHRARRTEREIDAERASGDPRRGRHRARAFGHSRVRRSASSRSPAGPVQGAVAYAGTRTLGEVAIRYFEARLRQPQARVAARRARLARRRWRVQPGPRPRARPPCTAPPSDPWSPPRYSRPGVCFLGSRETARKPALGGARLIGGLLRRSSPAEG